MTEIGVRGIYTIYESKSKNPNEPVEDVWFKAYPTVLEGEVCRWPSLVFKNEPIERLYALIEYVEKNDQRVNIEEWNQQFWDAGLI